MPAGTPHGQPVSTVPIAKYYVQNLPDNNSPALFIKIGTMTSWSCCGQESARPEPDWLAYDSGIRIKSPRLLPPGVVGAPPMEIFKKRWETICLGWYKVSCFPRIL